MISQRLLGKLNMGGIVDSKPNMVEAVKWLTEASKQGCSQSQCALGSILREGNGVQKNRDEAYQHPRHKDARMRFANSESVTMRVISL